MFTNFLSRCTFLIGLLISVNCVYALPMLQLGPGTDPGWVYDNSTDTWVLDGAGSLTAYANDFGASGGYAWDTAGAGTQIGYLVVAATPQGSGAGPTDVFDITVPIPKLDLLSVPFIIL